MHKYQQRKAKRERGLLWIRQFERKSLPNDPGRGINYSKNVFCKSGEPLVLKKMIIYIERVP